MKVFGTFDCMTAPFGAVAGAPADGSFGSADDDGGLALPSGWVFPAMFSGALPSEFRPAAAAQAVAVQALAPQSVVAGGGAATDSSTNTLPDPASAADSSAVALAVPAAIAEYQAATGGTLDGAGLTIGILSDSFNLDGGETADIANGLLPPASQIDILKEGSAGKDEGRAMAQLIHQIAPAATIDFHTATDSEGDFAAGIDALVAAGANVIVDDVVWTDEPFFQNTGVITAAVENAISHGIDYFSAASNSDSNFYQATFDPISVLLPGIGQEAANNVGGTGSPYEAISLSANPTLDFTVEWTQPYGGNAYDLGVGLYQDNGGTYDLVDTFANTGVTPNPVLSFDVTETLAAGTYYLAFYDTAGVVPADSIFKLIFFQDSGATLSGVDAGAGSGTSIGHELAPGVNTVAAVNVADTPVNNVATPVVEGFSASGPGETYLNAGGTLLASPIADGNPEFAATDGTSTSVFDPFDGTSAAAPNAAAVGLLMLQADGRLTTTQVTTLLERSAIPTASTITGGAGLIQADTAVAGAIAAAGTPIWTAQGGSTLWSLAANWSDDAAPGVADMVQISDGLGLFSGAYDVSDDVAHASIGSLDLDGGTYLAAQPTLTVQAADVLDTGGVTLGAGTLSLLGTLDDSGTLSAGSLSGAIVLGGAGLLAIGGAASGAKIVFSGSGGDLAFTTTAPATLTSGLDLAISGYGAGDTIDLRGLEESTVGAVHVAGSAVTVVDGAGDTLASLDVTGAFSTLGFRSDGSGGTELVACYLRGTAIATPAGERPIEALSVGDLVLTARGVARPIRWIGRRSYPASLAVGHPELQPVCFPAGSLAPGVPSRALYVSPRHAMLLGGVLVPANRLLGWNGIAHADLAGEIAYLHIELDTHDAILAAGAASETFADTGNRFMFQNAADFVARHSGDAGPAWRFCAPRLRDRAASEVRHLELS